MGCALPGETPAGEDVAVRWPGSRPSPRARAPRLHAVGKTALLSMGHQPVLSLPREPDD